MTAAKVPTPRVERWRGKDGKWYFHRKNRNGSTTEPSQGYTTKTGAGKAAARDIPGLPILDLG